MSRPRTFAVVIVGAALAGSLVVANSTGWFATLGSSPSGDRLDRNMASPNWLGGANGSFVNPIPTSALLPGSFGRTIRLQLIGQERRNPPAPLPIEHRVSADYEDAPRAGLRVTWLGHASTLVELDGLRLLFDPVLGNRASPSSLIGAVRSHPAPLSASSMPKLHAVIISHDHFDHLEMETIKTLASDPRQVGMVFIVPLGVGAHLQHWGVSSRQIIELDWFEQHQFARPSGVRVISTPARHFSGRGFKDAFGATNRTLWSSWAIIGSHHRLFFSGDTGSWKGFDKIGQRYGPFDLTMIKIGAYGPTWPDIHLTPEQAVEVHKQLRGHLLLPIHWATFNLAFHAWNEPIDRVEAAARSENISMVTPLPGQMIEPFGPEHQRSKRKHRFWWKRISEAHGGSVNAIAPVGMRRR